MKVAFDIKNLWLYGKGIGTFTLNLLRDLALTETHPEISIQLYSPSFESKALDFVNQSKRFQKIPTRLIERKSRLDKVTYDQVTLLKSLRRNQSDVLFSPYFDVPFFWKGPMVTTVHDLSIFEGREEYGTGFYLYYKTLLKKALHQSDFVVTVSDFSRKRIAQTFSVPPEKIKIIYNKVPAAFLQQAVKTEPQERLRLKAAYSVPDEFVLYTGGLEKRKNIALLAQGFKRARRDGHRVPKLVMTGVHPQEMPNEYRDLLNDDGIHLLGYLPYNDLMGIYKMASLVVNTSGYEGFGIPVLESLTLQKPILCSDIPVYREIGEQCVYYFRNGDTEDFANQLSAFFNGELYAIAPDLMAERSRFFNNRNYAETFFELITSNA